MRARTLFSASALLAAVAPASAQSFSVDVHQFRHGATEVLQAICQEFEVRTRKAESSATSQGPSKRRRRDSGIRTVLQGYLADMSQRESDAPHSALRSLRLRLDSGEGVQ